MRHLLFTLSLALFFISSHAGDHIILPSLAIGLRTNQTGQVTSILKAFAKPSLTYIYKFKPHYGFETGIQYSYINYQSGDYKYGLDEQSLKYVEIPLWLYYEENRKRKKSTWWFEGGPSLAFNTSAEINYATNKGSSTIQSVKFDNKDEFKPVLCRFHIGIGRNSYSEGPCRFTWGIGCSSSLMFSAKPDAKYATGSHLGEFFLKFGLLIIVHSSATENIN
jgi:hypothetical protein